MSGRDADDDLPADGDDDEAVPPQGDAVEAVPPEGAAVESEWRFSVDDVGPDGVTEDTATPETEPIEPGDIVLEHAALVALGVAVTIAVLLLGF